MRRLPRWVQPTALRIAAALVIVAGVGLVVRGLWPVPDRPVAAEPTSGELSELSVAQLRELLGAVDRPAADQDVVLAQDVGLEDLSEAQLRALLASLDGTVERGG